MRKNDKIELFAILALKFFVLRCKLWPYKQLSKRNSVFLTIFQSFTKLYFGLSEQYRRILDQSAWVIFMIPNNKKNRCQKWSAGPYFRRLVICRWVVIWLSFLQSVKVLNISRSKIVTTSLWHSFSLFTHCCILDWLTSKVGMILDR